MGLEFLASSGEVIRSGFEGTKGGTFGCGGGVVLKLLGEEGNQWCVEGTCLCCFVGDWCAGGGMHAFCDCIQVKTLVTNLLQQVSCED